MTVREHLEQTEYAVLAPQAQKSAETKGRAFEEEESEVELVQLVGTITEITDEYVMLDVGEMGQIQVNLTEDTAIEGVETLELGHVAFVTYNGMMTRSLPPQITALRVSVYAVEGTVTEVKGTVKSVEEGRITIETENGDVVLTLPEDAPELAVGDAITAYTTGISTMSLPPIQNAVAIIK